MLIEKLHLAANSGFAKFIFGLISVSFLVGGMSGAFFSSNESYAAKVNGEVISQQDFLSKYNAETERRAVEEGNKFLAQLDSPEFVNGIRQNIIQSMIDQELLHQYTNELRLVVPDEMIKRAIVQDPNFQTNGKFDNERYLQILKANGLNSDQFAVLLRSNLSLEQLRNGLGNSEFIVSDLYTEAEKLFFQNRQARVATLSLADEMAKQSASEDEVKAYFDANTKSFVQPEEVKVQYIQFSRDDVEKTINVTDTEIAQYYQDNKAPFTTQLVSDIQLANEQDAQAVYQELQKGASFAELAKTRSQDKISAENGGELGWVDNGALPKAFEDAIAVLQVGEYSQPIKVDGTFHIALVQERKTQPLDEVKDKVAKFLRQTKADNEYYAIEAKVKDKAFEDSKSLESSAEIAGVKVQETGYFSRQNPPEALDSGNVLTALFDSDISSGGVNSEPLNVGDQKTVVVRVLDHKAEGLKTYDEVKGEIAQLLVRQKAEKVLAEKADQAVKALTANQQVADIQFGDEQTFNLTQQSTDPILINSLFAIAKPQEGAIAYQTGRNSKGDFVVIALSKVEDGKLPPEQSQGFALQMMRNNQSALQQQLLQALRDRAKIEINEPFINQEDALQN